MHLYEWDMRRDDWKRVLDRIVRPVLLGQPYGYMDEFDLQEQISAQLRAASVAIRHEAPIAPGCRVDLLHTAQWKGNARLTGVEIKISGHPGATLRQLQRYTAMRSLEALILFTTVDNHRCLLVGACVGAHVEVIHLRGTRRRPYRR